MGRAPTRSVAGGSFTLGTTRASVNTVQNPRRLTAIASVVTRSSGTGVGRDERSAFLTRNEELRCLSQ
jgi:hypothetical protein